MLSVFLLEYLVHLAIQVIIDSFITFIWFSACFVLCLIFFFSLSVTFCLMFFLILFVFFSFYFHVSIIDFWFVITISFIYNYLFIYEWLHCWFLNFRYILTTLCFYSLPLMITAFVRFMQDWFTPFTVYLSLSMSF